MQAALFRPRLRPIDVVVVQDEVHGRALLLRDTEGLAPNAVVVPARWSAVIARFDGVRSIHEIAREAARAIGRHVDADTVAQLAEELERALMLEGPRLEARRREVVASFREAPVRSPSHAGGAYHGEREALSGYIERQCLGEARRRAEAQRPEAEGGAGASARPSALRGLCAPHMDLWRAPVGYGHAYGALAEALAATADGGADTFVLLGTSHAPMRRPFAVCEKTFATPLGDLEPDRAMIAEIAAESPFDVHEDQYLHKGEHSIEFQAVFLRHLLGDRPARIVPILCGLSDCQARGRDPARDQLAGPFIEALAGAIARRAGRALVIAGADLAHVGPRFGDPAPLDERQRDALRRRDERSIARAVALDAPGFFADTVADLDERRICGVGPIYTMLRALPNEARGEVLHYAQHVDPDEGSIVSHTSLAFYA